MVKHAMNTPRDSQDLQPAVAPAGLLAAALLVLGV